MKRKVYITRKDSSFTKYSGKVLNVWFDKSAGSQPDYKLAAGKTVTIINVDEKSHNLIIQRMGFLIGDTKFYQIPKGTGDVELLVDVDGSGKLTIRKKPGKKTSGSRTGSGSKSTGGSKAGVKAAGSSKSGSGTKSGTKTPPKTTRNLYVTRGSALGHLPNVPIRMVVDGTTNKQPLLYEFAPDMVYTITMDKKMHELVFFYPDVQTGDLVLRTLEAGSQDEAFYVDFDEKGVLLAVKTDLPKRTVSAGTGSGMKIGIADSPTAVAVKEYIANYIDLSKGAPVPVLHHALNVFEYVRVSVGSDAVTFYACHEGMDDQEVACCSYEFANKNTVGAAGTFTALNTLSQRNQLLAAIREFVNKECPGVSMKGTKIYLDASSGSSASAGTGSSGKESSGGKKTTTPDLDNSLTLITLNYEFLNFFDQDSQFAADLDKVAKTCFLSVEEDRVRVTIMVEDSVAAQELPDGGTQVKEFVYSELDTARHMEVLDITQAELDNQFDRLSREEDRQILMEKLLNVLGTMPHLIVEGNSFRSRRRGEELIDVAHSLTAAALKHKIIKMFAPDREFVDVLRYSNVEYCFVAAYSRCISFIYLDKDDETVEKFTYDFDELVGQELLEGEDCFGELKSEPEQVLLSELIGQGLAALPHLNVEYDTMVRVNTDMLPKKPAVYVKKAESETPDEPDISAKSVLADSPTTVALVAQLTEYFKEGSMFDQMRKNGMYRRISLNAGAEEITLSFWKYTDAGNMAVSGSLTVSGNMALDYAYFGAGQEGSFTELDMDQQHELEKIVWNAFPFLK